MTEGTKEGFRGMDQLEESTVALTPQRGDVTRNLQDQQYCYELCGEQFNEDGIGENGYTIGDIFCDGICGSGFDGCIEFCENIEGKGFKQEGEDDCQDNCGEFYPEPPTPSPSIAPTTP